MVEPEKQPRKKAPARAKPADPVAEPKKRTRKAAPAKVAPEPAPEPAMDVREVGGEEFGWGEAVPEARPAEDAAPIAPSDALQLVTFVLAGEEYGFPIMRVQEVLRRHHVHVTPIPNAPTFVEGVMNLRGRVIPVVGLRRRFGMSDVAPGRTARVIVVDVSGRTVGVSVDAVVEVATVDSTRIEPLPELAATSRSEFIVGVSRAGSRMVIVLDMDRVFSTEEKAAMVDLASATREETTCA